MANTADTGALIFGEDADENPEPIKSVDGGAFVNASPDSFNVTQHDSTADPDGPFIGIRFDAANTVSLVAGNGDVHALNVLAGEYWPGTVLRINDTGTALTNAQMVGFKRS